MKVNRRKFLSGAAAGAGALTINTSVAATIAEPSPSKEDKGVTPTPFATSPMPSMFGAVVDYSGGKKIS